MIYQNIVKFLSCLQIPALLIASKILVTPIESNVDIYVEVKDTITQREILKHKEHI